MDIDESLNVFGETLEMCSQEPITGFYRDGCCNTSDADYGQHTVCVKISQKFLEYSRFRGNDLSTPIEEFGFPGLKEGDRWCLCAQRWLEAYEHEMAPKVYLAGTHQRVTETIPIELLKENALDLN